MKGFFVLNFFLSAVTLMAETRLVSGHLNHTSHYYGDFDFHLIDKRPLFFQPYTEKNLKGVWEKKVVHVDSQSQIHSVFNVSQIPPHVRVFFDNQNNPTRVERYSGSDQNDPGKLVETVHLNFDWVIESQKVSKVRWENPTASFPERIMMTIEYNKKEQIKTIKHYASKKRLLQTDHYFFKTTGLVILKSFPKGRIKEVLVFDQSDGDEIKYKMRTYAVDNVFFEGAANEPSIRYNFIADFEKLMSWSYANFPEWEVAIQREGHGSSREKVRIQRRNEKPELRWHRDNRVSEIIYLKDVAGSMKMDDSYTLLSENGLLWNGYRRVVPEPGNLNLVREKLFKKGLLVEESLRMKKEKYKSYDRTTFYRYLPNRKLLNRSTYFNGALIDQEQYNFDLPETTLSLKKQNET